MPRNLVAQVVKPGAPFEVTEREIQKPGPREVLIKVEACGICHSDMLVRENMWPGLEFPRIPGHEVAGTIQEVGPEVMDWKKGQRVGVGWHGKQCFRCNPCRRGDFANCERLQVTGFAFDGGYQQYMVVPIEGLASLPEGISFEEAGPLLCAGITTFNSLRHSGALPGDTVAIQGVGGLGHLGIQFASKFGYKTVAVGRGSENEQLAQKLGAHSYIDSSAKDVAKELTAMGGARAVLATAPSGKSMTPLINGLGANGVLLVVGAAPDPIEVSPLQLIPGMKRIQGWASGVPADSEDTLKFSAMSGVRPMIEKFPLKKANEAYDRMMSGQAQFRVVLTME